jgi:UDP-N-acetylglucosamine 2-epimerase
MRIATIVGARPQFIKLAPFSRKIREKFEELIIHTGQHYDPNMSGNFFQELQIPEPDYNLEIGSESHGVQTGQMLIALEKIINKEKPDLLVVFGDTNSTLAGALVGSKMLIPVVHVEAGLRSFNRRMPEEINRVVADHCADLLFAPTGTAVANLTAEKLDKRTFLSGDIMLDTLQDSLPLAEKNSNVLQTLQLKPKKYHLLTLHRPYTVDDLNKLQKVMLAIARLDLPVIFPVHPRTRKMIMEYKLQIPSNIVLTDPQGYFDFLLLQKNASHILTDSGGIQKEAYLLKVPCITLRPETEWVETVKAGWNMVIGNEAEGLANTVRYFHPGGHQPAVFGNYSVAEKMVGKIGEFLSK